MELSSISHFLSQTRMNQTVIVSHYFEKDNSINLQRDLSFVQYHYTLSRSSLPIES